MQMLLSAKTQIIFHNSKLGDFRPDQMIKMVKFMKTRLILSAILFSVFFLSPCAFSAENGPDPVKSGDRLVSEKKFGEAVVKYHAALKQSEKSFGNAEIYYKLGKAYQQLKEEGAAAHYFREALRRADNPARKVLYYQDLAAAYLRVRDFAGMAAVLDAALQDPAVKKFEKRLESFRQSQYRSWISIFIAQKKYDQAFELLEKQKSQLNRKMYMQLFCRIRQSQALDLIREKKYTEAETLLRKTMEQEGIASDAGIHALRSTLMTALLQQKKTAEAQVLLKQYSEKDREQYAVAVLFADFYAAQKQYGKSIECLAAVKKDANAQARRLRYSKMCDYALRNQDGKSAFEFYREARAAVNGKWRMPVFEARIKTLYPDADIR